MTYEAQEYAYIGGECQTIECNPKGLFTTLGNKLGEAFYGRRYGIIIQLKTVRSGSNCVKGTIVSRRCMMWLDG